MSIYSRRTFLKRSAMLTATAAAGRLFLPSVAGSPHSVNQQSSVPPFFAQAKSLDVIAHRGGDDERPGETMYAYKHAAEIGVDVLEMDVYRTIDNRLVLMHNMTVNETTNGKGLVSVMKLDKLKRLNAGFNWNKGDDSSKFYQKEIDDVPPEIRDDLRVATLDEVFKAYPQMRMNIEMKPSALSPVKELCRMIRESKMEDKVLVASFSHLYLR
jgi:glycerophosphoryl diester phosphodiesterase